MNDNEKYLSPEERCSSLPEAVQEIVQNNGMNVAANGDINESYPISKEKIKTLKKYGYGIFEQFGHSRRRIFRRNV